MMSITQKKLASRLGLLAIFSFISISSGVAHAEYDDVRKLTQNNVRAFIEDTSHMTKPRGEFLSSVDVQAYLNKHLSEDARFVSTITYKLPDMDPQSTTISLDKAKFMDTVNKGTESIEGYDNTVTVNEVKINWWANKAHVKTENTETGFMPVPNPDGKTTETVPIEGHSTCAQTVDLNDGVIQMSNAVCKTEIIFKE